MSNQINMRRRSPRELVPSRRVRKAWHIARNRKVSFKEIEEKDKNDKVIGKRTVRVVSMNNGPSMKQWAQLQIQKNTADAVDCSAWLDNKEKSG